MRMYNGFRNKYRLFIALGVFYNRRVIFDEKNGKMCPINALDSRRAEGIAASES